MRIFRVIFICAVFAAPGSVKAQVPVLVPDQSARPLKLPTSPQQRELELQPGQNELELPQVVREFVGTWGGHLYLLSTGVSFGAPESRPESFTFGQRHDGTVYIETSLWGKAESSIVSARARVITPTKIEIRIEHLASDGNETRTIVQKESILLKGVGIMDCIESDQIFRQGAVDPASGYEQPMYSAIYHGSLRQISEAESEDLEDELRRLGALPQMGIEGSQKFSP